MLILEIAGPKRSRRCDGRLHVGMMFTPLGREVLHVEPVSLTTFIGLRGLALTVFVAMQVHNWTWASRARREAMA